MYVGMHIYRYIYNKIQYTRPLFYRADECRKRDRRGNGAIFYGFRRWVDSVCARTLGPGRISCNRVLLVIRLWE